MTNSPKTCPLFFILLFSFPLLLHSLNPIHSIHSVPVNLWFGAYHRDYHGDTSVSFFVLAATYITRPKTPTSIKGVPRDKALKIIQLIIAIINRLTVPCLRSSLNEQALKNIDLTHDQLTRRVLCITNGLIAKKITGLWYSNTRNSMGLWANTRRLGSAVEVSPWPCGSSSSANHGCRTCCSTSPAPCRRRVGTKYQKSSVHYYNLLRKE